MKKYLLASLTLILIIPCMFLLSGCGGDPNTYLKATVGAPEHMTVTAPAGISNGEFNFIKGSNLIFYVTVDFGYDPKTVGVSINNNPLTPYEIVGQFITYSAGVHNSNVTLQITNPQIKVDGVYDFFEVRAADGTKLDDYHDVIYDAGWIYGSVRLTLSNGALTYTAGNPEPISTGDYTFINNVLSFTPIDPENPTDKIDVPLDENPGYIKHAFANNTYYIIFALDYAYDI